MQEMVTNDKDRSCECQQSIKDQNKSAQPLDEDRPQAECLLDLILQRVSFFHTPSKEAYVAIDMGDHQEIWSAKSKEFGLWVRHLVFKELGAVLKPEELKKAIATFESIALFDSPEREVFIRYARTEDAIYIDMADKNWRQIEITKNDWRVISGKESPVAFKRTPSMLPLPDPIKGGCLTVLRNFLNLRGEHEWRLIVAWLLGATRPEGPFPVLIFEGEQGTAKTTTANLLKDLIDPTTVSSRSKPRTERDLVISASAAWVLSYDNLSGLSDSLSDAFCRLATGGGFGTRKLYTDSSEALFSTKRPLVMNGISSVATRQDFADRSMVINLLPISDTARKSEREIKEAWKQEKPAILGALYDAVSAALRNEGTVKLEAKPRMADFAIWVASAEEALPWDNGTFLNEYMQNREMLVDIGLEDDPVGFTVLEFAKRLPGSEWSGTATELLFVLNRIALTADKKDKDWPKRHNALSKKLMRVAGFLRKRGVEVVRHNTRPRSITIRRTALPSPEPDRGRRTNGDNVFVSDHSPEDINPPALPESNAVDT